MCAVVALNFKAGDVPFLNVIKVYRPPALIEYGEIGETQSTKIVKTNDVIFLNVGETVLHAVTLCQTVMYSAVDDSVAYTADHDILLLLLERRAHSVIIKVTEHVIHRAVGLSNIAVIEDYLEI